MSKVRSVCRILNIIAVEEFHITYDEDGNRIAIRELLCDRIIDGIRKERLATVIVDENEWNEIQKQGYYTVYE